MSRLDIPGYILEPQTRRLTFLNYKKIVDRQILRLSSCEKVFADEYSVIVEPYASTSRPTFSQF